MPQPSGILSETSPSSGVYSAPTSVLYVAGPHEPPGFAARLRGLGAADVTIATDAAEALRALADHTFTLAIVHLSDERKAISAIRAIRSQQPHLAIAGLMEAGRPFAAAEAVRSGVVDLLSWPPGDHDLAALVSNSQDRAGVTILAPESGGPAGQIFANSAAMRLTLDRVHAAADDARGVLLCGERGSGRAMIARAIHDRSHRRAEPFVAVDCASGSLAQIEVRLFGVVTDRRAAGPERRSTERVGVDGAIYRANGGTLLLQNIVDAPTRVQAKLAKLFRDREAGVAEERLVMDLDVRAITAVDSGLDAAVAEERIRRDLFEWLAQERIDLPPLRRRREDIPLIATHLLQEVCEARDLAPKTLSRAVLVLLAALPWPGNGRELRTLLDTLALSVPRSVVQLDDLFEHVHLDGLAARVEAGGTLREAKARFERDWIGAVLMKHHGRVGEAAKALGIQRTNLYRKVRQLKVAKSLLGPRRAAP